MAGETQGGMLAKLAGAVKGLAGMGKGLHLACQTQSVLAAQRSPASDAEGGSAVLALGTSCAESNLVLTTAVMPRRCQNASRSHPRVPCAEIAGRSALLLRPAAWRRRLTCVAAMYCSSQRAVHH